MSVINYLDRQALSILATTIQADLGISNAQYAMIVQAFLLAYTAMHLLGGRLVDRFGARIAETGFIAWWSVANMLTTLATGFLSLAVCRTLLGLGEPGHYSASGKTVAEWFPARERGVAVGMYTMGGTLGAALAAPLVSFLALQYGWRSAFLITGLAGLVPALIWFILYRPPAAHPLLTSGERDLLAREGVLDRKGSAARAKLRDILRMRPLWLVMGARMLTDPLWYFYLFWFPKYLQEARGFSLADVGATAWVIYLSADGGCILGGWLSGRLVRAGTPAARARLRVMTGAAAVLAFSFLLPLFPGKVAPLILASVFTCAEMIWMSSCVTLPLDLFPSEIVGSVQGTIGAGGSLGGFFATGIVGYLVTHFSYSSTFALMSFLHPAAIVLLLWRIPRTAAFTAGRKEP